MHDNLHHLTMNYFNNFIFGHLMASLNKTFHPSKTIVYIIKIIQIDSERLCNLMALNPCIIPLCLMYNIINIMHIKDIFNSHYIVCYSKTENHSDLDCNNQILTLLSKKKIGFFRLNIMYTCPL